MILYWFFIRDSRGNPIKVTEYAENPFRAYEIAKAKYGSNLISENANQVNS